MRMTLKPLNGYLCSCGPLASGLPELCRFTGHRQTVALHPAFPGFPGTSKCQKQFLAVANQMGRR